MKIIRFFNVIAILALIGSALYAYSISYQTMLFSADISKTKDKIQRVSDDVNMLKADWAHLIRPQRIQALADKYLDLQNLRISQIVGINDLPDRPPQVDEIGRKLTALGLAAPTSTPRGAVANGAATPQH